MGVGTSLIVFAIGAILRFAVTIQSANVSVHTIGVILMIVGGIGFLVSLLFWSSWGGFGGRRRRRSVYRRPDGSLVEEERHDAYM